jgi:hypothetical protein
MILVLLFPGILHSFPPAPHHTLFGQVRDEWGNPIISRSAEVFFESSSGVLIKTAIIPGLDTGVNYRIHIPMDSGLTSDLYKPTAQRPSLPFRLWVRIQGVTFLPIEMTANYSTLGKPGAETRIDLTLGEDSDGDGLPDAWERILLALLGSDDLSLINPHDDFDGDGLSNLEEYLAGTYAFDPEDGFSLKIAGFAQNSVVLEFLAIRGRTYKVLGSDDLKDWKELQFRPFGANVPLVSRHYSSQVQNMRVEVPPLSPDAPALKFFKLTVH